MMNNSQTKFIWITGASSGLGRGLALKLAREGCLVLATARNAEALEKLTAVNKNIVAMPGDIANPAAMDALQTRIRDRVPHLDQVILNAGVCEYLDFPNPDWDAIRRVMEINFFGTIKCVEIALPLMRQSTDARPQLVAIASQVTAAPFPRAEAYGASKAAMRYFFDSLRIDLASDKIDVTVVNPGFVDTPLTRRNDFPMPFLMDVERAVQRVARGIESRPRHFSFPLPLSALLMLSRLWPGLWQKMLAPKKPQQLSEVNGGSER